MSDLEIANQLRRMGCALIATLQGYKGQGALEEAQRIDGYIRLGKMYNEYANIGANSHTTQDKDHGQQAKDQGGTEACD